MKLETMHDLYVSELESLHDAEHQLIKVLPKMAKAASNPDLAKAFIEHCDETKDHIDRLDEIFESLGTSPNGKKCRSMTVLIEEGKDVMAMDADPAVMDAALIMAVQRIEHYEMTGYGCVRTFARLLGYEETSDLLQETLDEEAEADRKLSKLAESDVNIKAVSQMAFV